MNEYKYLYAASVKGIQDFIFKTNKLKEIVGASALVDAIFNSRTGNKSLFQQFCEEKQIAWEDLELIVAAAGNLQCKVRYERDCEKIVKEFPKYISSLAPGLAITQTVVQIKEKEGVRAIDWGELLQKVNANLQAQRNKGQVLKEPPYMGVMKERRVGEAVVKIGSGNVYVGLNTKAKLDFAEGENLESFFQEFVGSEGKPSVHQLRFDFLAEDRWLAVIHADGNNVGKRIIEFINENKADADVKLSNFSRALHQATKKAVNEACAKVVEQLGNEGANPYPFRPIILGGDDITVVVRADKAMDFVIAYLKAFEKETKLVKEFGGGFTASAGVAFMKHNFPFHYAARMAYELTEAAKATSKKINDERPPSSLCLYKIQSSFVDSLDEMRKRTHWAGNRPVFYDDAYFLELDDSLNGQYYSIFDLMDKLKNLKKAGSQDQMALSKLRQYLDMVKEDSGQSGFLLDRMEEKNKWLVDTLQIRKTLDGKKSILFDVLQLYSMIR